MVVFLKQRFSRDRRDELKTYSGSPFLIDSCFNYCEVTLYCFFKEGDGGSRGLEVRGVTTSTH